MLAECTAMRHHARVATGQTRTASYSPEARARLGDAVMKARLAGGHTYRPAFVKAVGIKSLRSIVQLERGEPGVGPSVLYAVGRYLPNWTEDTPRIILEGGPIPPNPIAPEPSSQPDSSWPTDAQIIGMSYDDLAGFALKLDRDAGSQAAEDWLYHALSVRRDAWHRNAAIVHPS